MSEKVCDRCGELIPARWRHFQPMCLCTCEHHRTQSPAPRPLWSPNEWEPATFYCEPDPDCPVCQGFGQVPCIPQDLSTLRVSGVCKVCHAAAFFLTHDDGTGGSYKPVPGSARHRYVVEEDDDHEAEVTGGPLVPIIEDALIDAGHYNEGSGL